MSQIIMAKAIVSGEIEHRVAQWWVPGIVLCPFCGIAIEARGEGCACGASILPHAQDDLSRFTEAWDNARREVINYCQPLIDSAVNHSEARHLLEAMRMRLADIDREYEEYWRQCNRNRITALESPDLPILEPPRYVSRFDINEPPNVERLSEQRRRAYIDMAIAARDALMGIDAAEGQDEYVQRLTELPEPPQSSGSVLEALAECTRRATIAAEYLREVVIPDDGGTIRRYGFRKAESDDAETAEPEPEIDCPDCGGKTQALGRGDYFCLDCEWNNLKPLKEG